MKNRISLAIFLLLMHLCAWAQIGGDYNPTNPSDPGNPTQEYTLTLKASPTNGGSFNTTSTNIAGGKTYNMRAYPSTDFAFVAWLCNGDTLSKSSSYTYTMPYHDVEIIGVFTYSPSNPSDPQEQAQKYTLTLKATPTEGGSFNTSSSRVSVGERYNLRAYPNTDFAFVAWLCEGDTLSKVASYDYTMPSHNVDITGVFTYRPSSPSDPQEQALKYQLSLVAVPMNSGSFNISNERLAVGSNNSLRAYSNTDFVFRRWTMGDSVLSTNPNMDFVMPSHNVQIVGHFEYNPASPANPNANYWNKLTGEVIVDDFTAGYLSSAISSVISGSSSNDVQMITVSGRINSNDFGVANNYKNCSLLDLSRVTGVTEVPSYAFDYTNLETVYLPSSIEKIGARAFADCSKLSSITVYAMTPPTLESGVFQGVPDGIVVYVPAAAIAQYQDDEAWGKFTLLPIQEDIRSISISLPEGANASDYTQMWLELTNTKSGQRMHYVMTDRQTYIFANIIRNTSWNVTLRNERGDVFGQIDNVEVKDEDVSVVLSTLSKPQSVSLAVKTLDGQDVTAQTQITWTDAQGNYVAQGESLTGLPVGYQANYRVALSQELAMQYVTPQMVEYVLKDGGNSIVYQLEAIKQLQITGKVKDAATGLPLSGAVVSASQTFGGKYSKTLNAKTDNNGVFTLTIANVPTSVAFAASDYVSQTVDFSNNEWNELSEFTVPDVSLKSITGATISIGFSFTTVEGETQNWYSDYQNVSYALYNVTKNRAVRQYNVQYPQIVLLEDVEDGDVLRLTATSRTNAFMPVQATATIAEQKAEATFDIVELGQIQATFTTTGNAAVVASLYDAAGKLQKTYDYTNASLTISSLADRQYTLVSMGSSRLFNTIYDLAQLPQTGLVEGTDYVQHSVEVKSGQVTAININEVPTLDESKLYYTGDNTSFTVNKPSIVAGNYLTLTGHIDFKPAYVAGISNVQMIVDLPESCEFVENSVMVGNSTSSYTINGNQITIPMARYTDRVRFCIIPTLGGEYAPSAFVQFDMDGETVTQPIGVANYTVQDLFISVPSTVAKTIVLISGTAIGQSAVEIYDDGMLIGNTTSLANGTWETTCELNEPYNLSTHNIYARVTTKAGLELVSETKQVVYDKNMVVPEKVTMLYYNPEYVGQYNIVFDLINGGVSPKSYYFFPYKSYPNWWGSGTEPKDFTFIADLSNNDSTAVNGVTIRVYTDNGYWRNLEAQYNTSMNRWVAVSKFVEEEAPVGVEIEIDPNSPVILDADILNGSLSYLSNVKEEIADKTDYINSIWNDFKQKLNESDNQEQLDLSKSQLFDALGIIRDGSSSITAIEDPFDELLTVGDLLLVDSLTLSIDSILQTSIQDFKFEIEGLGIISLTDCSSISENYIIDNDFVRYEKTDGTIFYVLANDETYEIIDFNINLHAVVLSKSSAELSRILVNSKRSADDIFNIINSNAEKIEKACDRLKSIVSMISNAIGHATNLIEGHNLKLTNQLAELAEKQVFFATHKLPFNAKIVEAQCDALVKTIQANDHIVDLLKNCDAKLKFSPKMSVSTKVGKGFAIVDIIYNGYKVAKTYRELANLYSGIMPCKGDEAKAEKLQKDIRNLAIQSGAYFISQFVAAGITLAGVEGSIMAAIPTGGASVSTAIVSIGLAVANFAVSVAYENHYEKSVNNLEKRKRDLKCSDKKCPRCGKNPCECPDKCPRCGNRPCTCPPKCPRCGQNPCVCPPPPNTTDVQHDPSGYVYEGVASNRLQGVIASCYYKETVEDMYGDLHDNVVLWDAEEYAQENPLFTDENGMYRWDVPQGLWQVKFEKEGYETTYSEWLPVPPPQLDVNIALKQNVQPMVKQARAFEDAVEAEFDKYMLPELLTTENVIVMQGGKPVDGTIELLNEEASYENSDETFASKLRFNAALPFAEQEVTLMVSNRVKSYAGIRMQDDFSQTFTVEQEIKQIVCEEQTDVDYGDKATLAVSVLPASASKGKTLKVMTSSPMILGVETEQVIIDEEGKAEITLSGELPGTAALTFSVEGTDKTAITIVNIQQKVDEFVAAPTANIASGSTVEVGTQITLFCKTEGATIYYTLDGSCPCDNTAARKVYNDGTPIVINENTIIKAMAVAPDMTESDVVEFTYIVATPTSIEDIALNGEIQVFPLPIRDKLNVRAGGKTIKNVTVSSMKGVVVAESTKAATKITLDVSPIPTGLYIINVTTEDGAYNRKVLKVE